MWHTIDAPSSHQWSADTEQLSEQVWLAMKQRCPLERVRVVIAEVAARYIEAKITVYVPIIVRREAIEMLRSDLARGGDTRG